MAEQWIKYVQNFDHVLEQAVLITVRNCLKFFFEVLHGDGTTGPNPVIKININLKNNKVSDTVDIINCYGYCYTKFLRVQFFNRIVLLRILATSLDSFYGTTYSKKYFQYLSH